MTFVLLVSGALALTVTILDEDFEGGCPPAGWTVTDSAPGPNTAVWGDLVDCGEAGNYTNGADNACCVSTDMAGPGVEVATELITPPLDLSQCEDSVLAFTANYQNLGSSEFFDVDYSADGGATWYNLLSWNEDHGTFRGTPGVDVNLDLSAADGAAHVQIRFFFYDPGVDDWGWYVQVDDVSIECYVPGPPVCTVTVSTPEPATTSQIAACVHIDMSSHPDPLGSYGAELTWDPLVLDYVSWTGGDPPFLEPTVNTDDVGLGLLTFADADPNGAGGNVYVSCGQFDVIGVADSSSTLDLEMTSVYTAGTFIDLMPTAEAFDDSVSVILECTIGDVNDDGSIDSGDALIILSNGIGLPIPPELDERLVAGCGNADGEGDTDATDANVILSFEIGLDVSGNPIDGSNATIDDCADCSG
jgi:hypothetical protein